MIRTSDGGAHWSAPVKTGVPESERAIASPLLADGRLLLAFNNAGENREDLSLAVSEDSATPGASCAGSKRPGLPGAPVLPNTRTRDRAGPGRRDQCSTPGGVRASKHVHFNTAWL